MSKLAELYKQAHDLILKKYQDEPEDHWKIDAIVRSRAGEKGHESTMFQFVKDIEAQVDELVKSISVAAITSPNKKEVIASAEPVKPAISP